jgi:dCMP deaminase
MSRPDWDEYFLIIAEAVASRSDCERSKVGAVVVKDRRVRATGYNGAPSGKSGCATCPRRVSEAEPGVSDYSSGATRCVAIHAEANALLYCDREDLVGATLYVTREPCYACEKLIEAAGIAHVIWPEKLDKLRAEELMYYGFPQRLMFGVGQEIPPHYGRIVTIPDEVVEANYLPDLSQEINRRCLEAINQAMHKDLSEILSATASNWETVR